MMEFLAFTFASVWHFLGVILLLLTVGEILEAVARQLSGLGSRWRSKSG